MKHYILLWFWQIMAVKKIDSLLIQGGRGGEFSEIVSSIFKLCHSNIAELDGYCSEQGQNMLVYEYFRNGSLHGFLHLSDDFSKPLTWNTRVRIALGTARALEWVSLPFPVWSFYCLNLCFGMIYSYRMELILLNCHLLKV